MIDTSKNKDILESDLYRLFYQTLFELSNYMEEANDIDSKELLSNVTHQIAKTMRLPAVWIGYLPKGETTVRVYSVAGPEGNFVKGVLVSADPNIQEGQGSVGQAMRTGQIITMKVSDPDFKAWREEIMKHHIGGVLSAAATRNSGDKLSLSIYYSEGDTFPPDLAPLVFTTIQKVANFLDKKEERLQNEAEQIKLQIERDLIGSIFDSIGSIVFVTDRNGKVIRANKAALEFTGLSLKKMNNEPFFFRHFLFPLSNDDAGKIFDGIASGKIPSTSSFENTFINKDGIERVFEWSYSIMRLNSNANSEYIVSIGRDITNHKMIEDTLARTQNIHKTILNNSLVGIALVKERRFVQVNNKMAEIFKFSSADEMIGQLSRIIYISDEQFQEVGKAAYSTLADGREYKTEFLTKRKDGSEFWCLLTGKAVNPDEMDSSDSVWIFQDIDDRKKQEIKLERAAYYDALTGLPNRRLFEQNIEKAMARSDRSGRSLAICFMDLDGFKQINDNYGHDSGDLVLIMVAERLSSLLRKSDTVTRLGGDEFILMLENLDLNTQDDLNAILHKVENAVKAPIDIGPGITVSVGISIGVCRYPDKHNIKDPEVLLVSADKVMYLSKARKSGRASSWVVYE